MRDDFSRYEKMKETGSSPEEVYREAVKSRVDAITRIRLVRAVYSLSPGQAKEVIARAEGHAEALDQHQANIAENLEH